MKNVINYTSLPTTSNGTLRAGIWLTALNEDIVNGDLVLNSTTLPDTIEVTVNGVTQHPNVLPLIIAGFERCYGSKSQLTVSEHIKLAAEGFVTPLQKNTTVTSVKEKGAFSNTKSVLSAVEYSNNCIKLGLDNKNFNAVSGLVSEFYSLTDKATKADLHAMLKSFVDVFMNAAQHETFVTMVQAEELAAKRFEGLTNVGFTDIKELSKGYYSGVVSLANVSTAIPELSVNGFDVVATTLNGDAMSLTVTFKESTPD
jgi:hypothetical protein